VAAVSLDTASGMAGFAAPGLETRLDAAAPGRGQEAATAPAAGEAVLVGLALVLCATLAVAIYLPPEEDAFIYYRYALNWVRGKGLTFNPGEAVEGYSSPLWMALVGLLARLGCRLPLAVPVLGIGCGAATVAATWRLARRAGLDRFGRLASVFGLALAFPFLLWSRSGLETPLYSLLLVLTADLYLAAEYPPPADPGLRRRLRLAGGVMLALVGLARPEGALLIAVVAVDRLADRRDWKGAARYLAPAVAGYGAYLLWRLGAFGTLVPNTSVKLYPLLLRRSTRQILGYFILLGALPPLLPAWALCGRTMRGLERRRLAFLVSMVVTVSLLFQVLSGGDYRTGSRFMVPTLPILLVTIWLAAARLEIERWRVRRPFASLPARLFLLALVIGGPLELLVLHMPTAHELPRLGRAWSDPYAAEPADWRVPISRWVVEHAPDGSVVAFGQMGKVPYYAIAAGREITFLDTLGLMDRQVAGINRLDHKLAALGRELAAGRSFAQAVERGRRERTARLAGILLARHPDFIIVETYLTNYQIMLALLAQPAFATRYREVAEIPPLLRGPLPVRIYALRAPRPPEG
jgi:hypothetical protein